MGVMGETTGEKVRVRTGPLFPVTGAGSSVAKGWICPRKGQEPQWGTGRKFATTPSTCVSYG